MRKRTLILPAILIGCLAAVACTPQEEAADPVQPVLKSPVTVDEMREKAKENNEKIEAAKATLTVTPTSTPTATPTPAPEPTPEPIPDPTPETTQEIIPEPEAPAVVEEPIIEEAYVEEYYDPGCSDYDDGVQYGDYYYDCYDIPQNQYDDYGGGMQLYGYMTITWYSRDEVGYDAPGASGLGCIPGYTCAMPDYSLLGSYVYIEGYGTFLVSDISPSGIADIYVSSSSEIPSYGMDYQPVYLVY